jgi:hypothetical protein
MNALISNYQFYLTPGMGEGGQQNNPQARKPPFTPFDIAYSKPMVQQVATNKWWSRLGLQWSTGTGNDQFGFASGWNIGTPATDAAIAEPFYMQFIDLQKNGAGNPYKIDIPGLRLENMDALYVNSSGRVLTIKDGKIVVSDFSPSNVDNQRGPISSPTEPVVTVGLAEVHPLGTTQPTVAPWTNVKVNSYSDWGVVFSYADSGSRMQITAASGSPFVWFERVSGSAHFKIWAGSNQPGGTINTWTNSGPDLGITVTNALLPTVPGTDLINKPNFSVLNTGDYAIYADTGTWKATPIECGGTCQITVFENADATRVAVLAVPHNVTLKHNDNDRIAAAKDLGQYACRKITSTQLDYPPIPGSQQTGKVGNQDVPLGYFQSQGILRYQLRATTTEFALPNCDPSGPALQMLMPHHVEELYPGQDSALLSYDWHSLVGSLIGFKGSTFVDQLNTLGTLSIFPSVLANSQLQNPLDNSQKAVEDVYASLTNWYYLQEPNANYSSYVRNLGTYDNVGANTYEQTYETLIDTVLIADQLSQSTILQAELDNSKNQLTGACLCLYKNQVAGIIRDKVLQDLESIVAQWFDIYTAHLLQYFPQFNTIVGFPAGYGAVQNFNDHHFHYGYFLRAAALIGKYDPKWLSSYQGIVDQLRLDVANYDRNNMLYPWLRNFDAYSGHSWASGAGEGSSGENQESTSEAVNFAAGMLELAQLENNKDMLAVSELLYEQEIRGAEDYWFNVNGDLTKDAPPPITDYNNVKYNGNWPEQWVTYNPPTPFMGPWHVTIAGIYQQTFMPRNTFFGGSDTTYTIQHIPMSPTGLWQGRNQQWLKATWQQFLLDWKALTTADPSYYSINENIFADMQARLPDSNIDSMDGTGLKPALLRITSNHHPAPYALNHAAKYWAYTNSLVGQVDTSVYADQPNYAVFAAGNSMQTFVAYNPGSTQITANFYKVSDNTKVASFLVPAGTVVSQGPAGTTSFSPDGTAVAPRAGQLYLQTATNKGQLPLQGSLTTTPGTWLPTSGEVKFPESDDLRAIEPSITTIPVATGNCADVWAPGGPECPQGNAAYGQWIGTFSGALDKVTIPHTTLTVYTNPAVGSGWQQNPAALNKVVTHVLVKYWFSQDEYKNKKYPDRIEAFWNGNNASNNTFVIGSNELTHYYFGCYSNYQQGGMCDSKQPNPFYGYTALAYGQVQIVNFNPHNGQNLPIVPFPVQVACGVVEVDVFGSAGPYDEKKPNKAPVPVSTGSDPVLGRASWVRPPYDNMGSCKNTHNTNQDKSGTQNTQAVESSVAANGSGADGNPVASIQGSEIVSYVSEAGTINRPDDLSQTTVAAYVPDGSGGYAMVAGSGTADGHYQIPASPIEGYLLRIGSSYFWTNSTKMDTGSQVEVQNPGQEFQSKLLNLHGLTGTVATNASEIPSGEAQRVVVPAQTGDFQANIDLSAFEALNSRMVGSVNSGSNQLFTGLAATPTYLTAGDFSGRMANNLAGALVAYNINVPSGNPLSDLKLDDVSYRNDFPASYSTLAFARWSVGTSFTAAGANYPISMMAVAGTDSLTQPSAPLSLEPQISPVTALSLDGADAFRSELSDVSLVPRITWDAPLFGTATVYQIDVIKLMPYSDPVAGGGLRTKAINVATFRTQQTALSLPAGVLEPGTAYVVSVSASHAVAQAIDSAPLRIAYPFASAEALSQMFTTAGAQVSSETRQRDSYGPLERFRKDLSSTNAH